MEGQLERGQTQDCKFYIHLTVATLAMKIATQTLHPWQGSITQALKLPTCNGEAVLTL